MVPSVQDAIAHVEVPRDGKVVRGAPAALVRGSSTLPATMSPHRTWWLATVSVFVVMTSPGTYGAGSVGTASFSSGQTLLGRAEIPPGRSPACPPGAGMIGAKLDLPQGGDAFETAALLVPCSYKGMMDTDENRWTFYKLSVQEGQTLKAMARLRDAELPAFYNKLRLRIHSSTGAAVAEKDLRYPSELLEVEYMAKESGFAYISVANAVRDTAFQVSIR